MGMIFCDVWYVRFLRASCMYLLVHQMGISTLSCMRSFSLGYVLTILHGHMSSWTKGLVCIALRDTYLHVLAGICDGVGALYEKLFSGRCINKSTWMFIESQTKGFVCIALYLLPFPVDQLHMPTIRMIQTLILLTYPIAAPSSRRTLWQLSSHILIGRQETTIQ